MDLITQEKLTELAQIQGEPCVSIFMPTYHVESEMSQNPIRLKNLIRKTRQELESQGFRGPDADQLLAPLQALVENTGFWLEDQGDGFAAFLTKTRQWYFRVPEQFEELVVTGNRFHLKPLFGLMDGDTRFYVLALAKHSVKLFEATHYGMQEIQSEEIPQHILEVIGIEEHDRSVQHHVANIAGGRHDGMFHGRGVQTGDDTRPHDELVRFFRGVDDGVRNTLDDNKAPLVLAGVEYYLPLYREASRYKNLVSDGVVHGNPEFLHPKVLHEKAWGIVEPLFCEARDQSIERYDYLAGNGNGLASDDIHEILPGAVFGRIDMLFVEEGSHRWGRYDRDENVLELHEAYEPGDEDLLDLAAVHTLMHGGSVHTLPHDVMPGETEAAATFRFAADMVASES